MVTETPLSQHMPYEDHPQLRFAYVNHKGECAMRNVRPIRLLHGTTPYYKEPQWLLEAFDLDRQEIRRFAVLKMNLEH